MTPDSNAQDLVELAFPMSFDATMLRVTRAIEGRGLTIFTRVDHAAAAATAGLALPPTTVILYGRAEGGTPLMQAVPNAALDLPLRVLVREESATRSVVVFRPIAASMARLGVPEALLHRLEPAQQVLVDLAG